MATTTLGNKYTCFKCGTKFYDLQKPEPLCPKCSANQKDAPPDSEGGKAARDRREPEDYEEPEAPEIAAEEEEEIGIDEEPGDEDEDLQEEEY